MPGQVRHEEFHLVGQNAPIAQYEVFPQAGHVGGIKQGHAGLLRRAVGFAGVAGTAGGDDVHPMVMSVLAKRHNVFSGEFAFVEMVAAISAQVAVAGKQLGIGQPRAQIEGVDVGHALGADDAVDLDDGLLSGDGVVPAMKNGDLCPGLPAHLLGGIVDDRLFERNPGLWQSLGRQLQDLQGEPPMGLESHSRLSGGQQANYSDNIACF